MLKQLFLSFHFDKEHAEFERFVHRVGYLLSKQEAVRPYSYVASPTDADWQQQVGTQVGHADAFVLFVGRELGSVQCHEALAFLAAKESQIDDSAVLIRLTSDALSLGAVADRGLFAFCGCAPLTADPLTEVDAIDMAMAERCARHILDRVFADQPWIPDDGIPLAYLYDYEKVIIQDFVRGHGTLREGRHISSGCPGA